MHYQPIRRLPQYYEDGHDGIRMEKRLLRHLTKPLTYPTMRKPQSLPAGLLR